MPNPTVTVVGSYPRPPKEGGAFTLRKTLQALDRGEVTLEDLKRAQDDLVREVVAEQAAAGVELVTDGQIRWFDGQTRFAAALDGFRIGGLIRYFDNNTYYRQPEVIGQVGREEPIIVDEYRFAAEASPVPVKPVITGPYTLAVLSQDEHYNDRRALVKDLAVALNAEARDLAAAGATVIAFDEPALARVPGMPEPEPDVLAEAAASLVDGVVATTILQTYFGEVTLGEALFDLPFDGFGLDLVSRARECATGEGGSRRQDAAGGDRERAQHPRRGARRPGVADPGAGRERPPRAAVDLTVLGPGVPAPRGRRAQARPPGRGREGGAVVTIEGLLTTASAPCRSRTTC